MFHISIIIRFKLSAIGEFGFLCLRCQLRLIDIEVCQAICSIALIFLVNVIFDHECCRGQKQERTKAKQQVTQASRRLTSAVDRNVDIDVLTVLMVELENVHDDFCVIDEEYETLVSNKEHAEHQIVNGLDITAYWANVNEVYNGARNAFMQAKASKTSSVLQLGSLSTPADPLTHLLDQSATLPVQGTFQLGNNVNPDQPASSVVTVSSQTQSVTLSASSVQANNFPLGIGSIYPSG